MSTFDLLIFILFSRIFYSSSLFSQSPTLTPNITSSNPPSVPCTGSSDSCGFKLPHQQLRIIETHDFNEEQDLLPLTDLRSKVVINPNDDIVAFCTDFIVNSSVAKECGRFFDRDIMVALDICINGNYDEICLLLTALGGALLFTYYYFI